MQMNKRFEPYFCLLYIRQHCRPLIYCLMMLLGLFFILPKPECFALIQAKQKLALFPFTAKNIDATVLTESTVALMQNFLDRTNAFEVIERKKIESFMELEGLMYGRQTQEDMFRIGSKNGIDAIVHGTLLRSAGTLSIQLELLHVKGRRVCFSDTVRMSEVDVSAKLQETAQLLVQKFRECSDVLASPVVQTSITPPQNLKAVGTSKSIKLTWTHPQRESLLGFKIYRSTDERSNFTPYATTTEMHFLDDNLRLNESFAYKVTAIGATGAESEFSAVVTGKTAIAPNPPIFISVEPNIKSALLTWMARPAVSQTDKGLIPAGYKIYRKKSTDQDFTEVATVKADVLNYKDTALEDKTTYTYALSAFNSDMVESELSSQLQVHTYGWIGSLKAESHKIRTVPLSWQALRYEVVEGYVLYRSKDKDSNYRKIATIRGRTDTSYTDTKLADNTTYWYKVSAYNKDGLETDPSEPVSATTRDIPPTPQNLSAKSNQPRKVTLTWQLLTNPEDEIEGYNIYRAETESGPFVKIDDVSKRKSSYVDDNKPLKDNTVYYYKISAYNSVNAESSLSQAVSAKTKALPSAPASLKAQEITQGSVKLTWTKSPEPDVMEYQVLRKRTDEKDFDRLRTVKEAEYIDTSAKDNTEYIYAVRAVDTDGLISELSETVTIKTRELPKSK